ncbi:glycosyltransferase [Belliella pelovolcani]|uniref:glycosyltransferase n=1 Tax=Belliella pelovolcani TaxID=529505 RepID=UPI00391C1E0E
MKIVRIVSELDFGGVEQVLANSIPQLADQVGAEVSVIVLGKGGRVSQKLISRGVSVHILNQNPRIPNFVLLHKLYKLIKNLNPDVIHCQGSEANFHGILAASWVNVPNIIGEEIGIPNHHSYWKLIFKLVYTKATTIIAISEAVKANIVAIGEVEERKVEVLYNPVGLNVTPSNHQEESDNENDQSKPFIFITTCRLVPIKNLDKLLIAFSELLEKSTQQKIELWIVGDGPLKEELQALAKELKIVENVNWLGFQEEVQPFLNQAEVFILPSLREGSSVSLAEAMTCGLPSIVTQVGGAGEILGNSNSGILIDPLDTHSIKSAMLQLLNLPKSERQTMGKRAMKEAKRFSVDNYIKSLLKIYEIKV